MKHARVDIMAHAGDELAPDREDLEILAHLYEDGAPLDTYHDELYRELAPEVSKAGEIMALEIRRLDTTPPTSQVRIRHGLRRVRPNFAELGTKIREKLEARGHAVDLERSPAAELNRGKGLEAFEQGLRARGIEIERGPTLGNGAREIGPTLRRTGNRRPFR